MINSGTGEPASPLAAAAACRERLASAAASSQDGAVDDALAPLLAAIRRSDPRFAFETEGRADAVAAVRQALPAVERDLYDAVIEDHACEVAALREALRQLALLPERERL